MNDGRDQSVERLLKRSLRTESGSSGEGPCLDAETLAAWADGGLNREERSAAETHLSQCGRCQMTLAAFARGDVPVAAEQNRSWRRWSIGWLVPLAAGAAAVAIWIAVPQPTPPPAQVSQEAVSGPPPGSPVTPADSPAGAPMPERTARPQTGNAAAPFGGGTSDARAERQLYRAAQSSAAPSPSSAAQTMAQARMLGALGADSTVIASPDPNVRWRIGGGALQYSSTGGRQWEPLVLDVDVELTAGVSPSGSVCWLVGRAGTVLRTTDGRRFERIPFPEPVDLAGVVSTSDMAATVTTSDGRVFRTSDGGVTWN